MRFHGNYGIHGTNNESSIGNYVSNGCIRMRERDVEELYEMIPIGTPVEITYNRVVVEKAADDTIVYYIYPDSYNMQPITVEMVNDWLKGFGVNTFENDESIDLKDAAIHLIDRKTKEDVTDIQKEKCKQYEDILLSHIYEYITKL